ncbi:MAG: copper resistance CopC/CopD family protein [Ilumatobacteraceae bacterium]
MRWRRAAVFVATTVAVLAPAQQVFAHAVLESTVPAASAVLQTGPPDIILKFDEAVDVSLADIELYDQTATLVPTGLPRPGADGSVVQASVPTLNNGVYVVVWRVPSDDGHVVNGVFSFQVGVQSGVDVGRLIDRVNGNATATSTVGRLDTASRLLALIGLIVLIGGGLLAIQAVDAASNRVLLWMGWAFLLVGTLGAFGMYGAKVVAGSPSDALKPSVWSKIEGSHTATELLWRMALVVALGGVLLAFARCATVAWRTAAAAICLGIVLTFSSIGHANTQHPTALWVGIDALHLTSLAVWIGGLVMLAFGTSTWLTDSGSERIIRRFSVTSMVAVPIIVATGAAQTLKLAGSPSDLTGTSWGRTLLVKVSVVTVLVAIGGVSQWLLRHDGPAALKRNVLVEALIGIGVVGLAAALVALPPQVAEASKVFTATLTNQGVIADVTVTPGRVGQNEVHLVITPPGGSLAPVVSTNVQAAPPAGGTGAVPATLQAIAANHYTGTITLSEKGDWSLTITVEPTAGQSVVLTSTVPIPG